MAITVRGLGVIEHNCLLLKRNCRDMFGLEDKGIEDGDGRKEDERLEG